MKAEDISKAMGDLGDKGKELQEHACKAAQNMCKVTDDFVRENPWWTVGMVAVAGLLVGLLLGHSTARS